jgi:hypothetical protein
MLGHHSGVLGSAPSSSVGEGWIVSINISSDLYENNSFFFCKGIAYTFYTGVLFPAPLRTI